MIKIVLEVVTVEDAKDGIKYLENFITINEKTVIEQPEVEKTVIEQPEVEKTVIEQAEVEKTVIDVDMLLVLAKSKVKEFDRLTVKSIISKYGSSISKVDINNYSKLYEDLDNLHIKG